MPHRLISTSASNAGWAAARRTDAAARKPVAADNPAEVALREVLRFLRVRTGRDFSYYKRATVLRRIARRMQVNGVAEMQEYVGCLRTSAGEAGALLQDLLISVTNFFRDAHCFMALEALVPELFRGKGQTDTVRVWVPACATGEEAYSIAILLAEHARTLDAPPSVQIFATDLDEQSIATARGALYPETIEADVTPERLLRYFVKQHLGYRVRREIRETVLFAVHDLLKDSPFSRLDLVSCRNLLIYLTRDAQSRALDIFHFALRPEGKLFLGSSDSIDEGSPLFTVLDKKSRLYAQRPALRAKYPILPGPGTLAFGLSLVEAPKSSRLAAIGPASIQGQPATPALVETTTEGRAASWAALHYRLLLETGRAALADRRRRPQHRAPVGKRGPLPAAVGRRADQEPAAPGRPGAAHRDAGGAVPGPAVGHADRVRPVDRRAERPADAGHDPGRAGRRGRAGILPGRHRCEGPGEAAVGSNGNGNTATLHPVAEHLDREVERLKAHLRDTVEQYEASNEELKAGNEELQAMNEELRSATEELETGREELQSINEELSTVNSELKNKVEELGSSNSDMLNLMDATAIPSVFLDRELHITRYTPPAVEVFNLIPADIGRPLSTCAPNCTIRSSPTMPSAC
jgi:two-component system CheB/CheR fusion protein